MIISKQNKMMMLFVSSENPIWATLLNPSARTITQINKLMKIANATLPNWRANGKIATATSEKIFDNVKARIAAQKKGAARNGPKLDGPLADLLSKRVDIFRQMYREERADLDLLSKTLVMPISQCQKIIDETIYDRLPMLSTLFYSAADPGIVEEDFSRYGGMFELFVGREVENDKIWLRCPLVVRYPIRIRDGIALRCKLNAPIFDPKPNEKSWEYDGFVAIKPTRLFWLFERRSPHSDYFFIITDTGRNFQERFTLYGTYLTSDQDELHSVATGTAIIRHAGAKTDVEIRKLMSEWPGILDNKKGDVAAMDEMAAGLRRAMSSSSRRR